MPLGPDGGGFRRCRGRRLQGRGLVRDCGSCSLSLGATPTLLSLSLMVRPTSMTFPIPVRTASHFYQQACIPFSGWYRFEKGGGTRTRNFHINGVLNWLLFEKRLHFQKKGRSGPGTIKKDAHNSIRSKNASVRWRPQWGIWKLA